MDAIVTGSSWEQLPLLFDQLIYDRLMNYYPGERGQTYASLLDTIEVAKDSGVGMCYLNEELNDTLHEGNAKILEEVSAFRKSMVMR